MKIAARFVLSAFALVLAGSAHATLVVSDFLTPGDHLLVTDSATGLQWLTPVYTRNHDYDDSFVQSIIATYGFAYASETQVIDMIDQNFNNPPLDPGTYAGYQDAAAFLNIFGIAANTVCEVSGDHPPFHPCPRTQGLTSTSSSPGTHDGVGMLYVFNGNASYGYLIEQNAWLDTGSTDPQVGSWLVRSINPVPEPASLALAAAGMALLAVRVRLRRRT